MRVTFKFGLNEIVRDTRSQQVGRVVRCVMFDEREVRKQLFGVQHADPENVMEYVPPEFLEAVELPPVEEE